MNKVAISALIGIAVAGAAMAAPRFGYPIPLPTLMMAAAALSLGAAMAVLTRLAMEKAPPKSGQQLLAGTQIKKAESIYTRFPKEGDGSAPIMLRPESNVNVLDIVKNPGKYTSKEVMITLKQGGPTSFNPAELKKLFAALTQQPGFLHLLLRDEHNEFVGYIPGPAAKDRFTGSNAESNIGRYIVDVFADPTTSSYLHEVFGASRLDWIDDEKNLSDAIQRMAGGFRCLVVLDDSNRRKPLGVITYETLMGQALKAASVAQPGSGMLSDLRPSR